MNTHHHWWDRLRHSLAITEQRIEQASVMYRTEDTRELEDVRQRLHLIEEKLAAVIVARRARGERV